MPRIPQFKKTARTVGPEAGDVGWQNRPIYIRPSSLHKEVRSTANRLMLRKMDATSADSSNYGGGSAAYRHGARVSGYQMSYDWLQKQMLAGR